MRYKFIILLTIILGAILFIANEGFALKPDEVLVIANRRVPEGIELAKYYMGTRGVPESNFLMLMVTEKEFCTRIEYNKKIADPVRRFFMKQGSPRKIRCLLIMYGLPLKVAAPIMDPEERKKVKELEDNRAKIESKIGRMVEHDEPELSYYKRELEKINKTLNVRRVRTKSSSLDSEIALVLEKDYSLAGWIANPFYIGYPEYRTEKRRDMVLMVSRLDGPNINIVKRIIDDSIYAEEAGLKGNAYFDARWPYSENRKDGSQKNGYAFYDRAIHKAAKFIQANNILPVIINEKQELFKQDECKQAALYCGWYSLKKYVDSFEWLPGSVGYHIASGECTTLKKKGSQVWCKRMLEEGAAGTIGPVREPYVQAFPIPDLFFKFLTDGYYTLAESYALSNPFWSWQMVLIGDPLYRPFKNIEVEKIRR